jgi:hypothetical protein
VRETRGAGLPAARAAILRLLEELPGPDGLSRIEREILRAIEDGAETPVQAFKAYQATEGLPFLGDAGFFNRLNRLAFGYGLIAGISRPISFDPSAQSCDPPVGTGALSLTARGRDALMGRHDVTAQSAFDRWVGGTHLVPDAVWRWNPERMALLPPR